MRVSFFHYKLLYVQLLKRKKASNFADIAILKIANG